eukprot:GHVQ01036919.1.p1 GENE.GHVQ01036919.1~~GHVQ01036919.1.p1  ORF type:complete len:187 (-),score=38.16 GHVQ01036919.1:155-715(-)
MVGLLQTCLEEMATQCKILTEELRQNNNVSSAKKANEIDKCVALYKLQERSAREELSAAQGRIREVERGASESEQKLQRQIDALTRRYSTAKKARWFALDGFRSECYIIKQKMKALEDFCGKLLMVITNKRKNTPTKLDTSSLEYQAFRQELLQFQERIDDFSTLLEECLTMRSEQQQPQEQLHQQ